MLDFARSATYLPGTNPKGDVAAASWALLLDALHDVDAVLVGEHAPITETAVSALFGGRVRRGDGWWTGPAPEVVVAAAGADVPPGLVGPATTVVRVGDVSTDADVALVADPASPDSPPRTMRSLRVPFAPAARAASSPIERGRRVLQRAATRLGRTPPAVARTSAIGPAIGSGRAAASARGTTMTFGHGRDARELPGYLRRIASGGGFDLDGRAWSMVADADYWSQKALFLVPPDLVVKVSRHPSFAARLANEYEGLSFVAGSAWGAAHSPAVCFAGDEGGLAVVGEELVDGAPLEDVPGLSPSSRSLRSALDAVRELGTWSVSDVPTTDVADALADLVGRYAELTALPADVRGVLDSDIERVAVGAAVATHGDATPWNIVVRPSGQVVFFDWENFEAAGMPGWDATVLVQTAAATAATRKGRRYTAAVLADQLLTDDASPWAALLTGEVARCLGAVGLGDDAVWPTVRLCLTFQALKEATRHPLDHRGLYAEAVEVACRQSRSLHR